MFSMIIVISVLTVAVTLLSCVVVRTKENHRREVRLAVNENARLNAVIADYSRYMTELEAQRRNYKDYEAYEAQILRYDEDRNEVKHLIRDLYNAAFHVSVVPPAEGAMP